jgi:hypothetical protein
VKLVDISETKEGISKPNIDELETNSQIKNTRYLQRGISGFKKGYHPRTNIVKTKRAIWLQTATIFWLGEGTISLSY